MFRNAHTILGLTLILNLGFGCNHDGMKVAPLQQDAWERQLQAADISLALRGPLEKLREEVLVDARNPAPQAPDHLGELPATLKNIGSQVEQCSQLYQSGTDSLRQASGLRIKDAAKSYFDLKAQWMEKRAAIDCDSLKQYIDLFLKLPQPPKAIVVSDQQGFASQWIKIGEKSDSLEKEALVLQQKADAIAAANPDLFAP